MLTKFARKGNWVGPHTLYSFAGSESTIQCGKGFGLLTMDQVYRKPIDVLCFNTINSSFGFEKILIQKREHPMSLLKTTFSGMTYHQGPINFSFPFDLYSDSTCDISKGFSYHNNLELFSKTNLTMIDQEVVDEKNVYHIISKENYVPVLCPKEEDLVPGFDVGVAFIPECLPDLKLE